MVSKLALCVGVILCLCVAINARSFDKGDHGEDDMEVAASGHSYKHGGGKDHHEEKKESHGKKGNEREKNLLVATVVVAAGKLVSCLFYFPIVFVLFR